MVGSRWFVSVCLIASLAVRVLWLCLFAPEPVSDFGWFYRRGLDLAGGRGYTVNGTPTAFWPVGYPGFLALEFTILGPSLSVARVSNVFLYIGVLYLSYALARELFSSEICGRVALGLLAFYPNHIAYSSLIATETLFLFLVLLGAAMFLKAIKAIKTVKASGGKVWALLCGVVFGLAVLVKSYVILLPIALVVPWLAAHRGWRGARSSLGVIALLYLALGATILPWVLRNHAVFGGLVLSNNNGPNLLYGNNPYATGTYDPGFGGRLEPLLNYTKGEYERNLISRRVALDYILGHPLETVKLWPVKLFYLYNEDGEGFMWNRKGLPSETERGDLFGFLIAVDQAYYLLMLAGFIVSLTILIYRRGESGLPVTPLLVIVYFTAASLLTIGHSRLHFPLVPWIAMYAAATIETHILPPNR